MMSQIAVVERWGVTGRKPNARFMAEIDADEMYGFLTTKLARLV
jgi:purine nucleosidase